MPRFASFFDGFPHSQSQQGASDASIFSILAFSPIPPYPRLVPLQVRGKRRMTKFVVTKLQGGGEFRAVASLYVKSSRFFER